MRRRILFVAVVSGLLAIPAFNPAPASSLASPSGSSASAQPAVVPAYERDTTCPLTTAVLYDHECRGVFRMEPGAKLSVKLTGDVKIADFGVFELGGDGRFFGEVEYVGDEWEKLWVNKTGKAVDVVLRARPFSSVDSEEKINATVRVEEVVPLPGAKLSHAEADARLKAAGIRWKSSRNCTDRNKKNCTSYEGIRVATVDGAIALKESSGCVLTVTGGTEKGHSRKGKYTHWNGYKLDFSRTSCLTKWIRAHADKLNDRGDGARQYQGTLNDRTVIYADEYWKNHWDVVYK
ncbi:hypothetical protein ACWCQQ_28195 [Streptomyces sp. NPDC002143]